MSPGVRWRSVVGRAVLTMVAIAVAAGPVHADEAVDASLSDLRSGPTSVTGSLTLRGAAGEAVDPDSVSGSLGGQSVAVEVADATTQPRSTILVIDTSGSMGSGGMATVRVAVRNFLKQVPDEVKIGVVSFASTSGVDLKPTTDHSKVQAVVDGLRSRGETALYAAVQDSVRALGTTGERSIVLLSDGGDTVEAAEGGAAQEEAQLEAAVSALERGKVRAEVVAFKSKESNEDVLQRFAEAGGGSVVSAADAPAVSQAFNAAAQALESQVALTVARPAELVGSQEMVITGTTDAGTTFVARADVDLGSAAPTVAPSPTDSVVVAPPQGSNGSSSGAPASRWSWLFLPVAVLALFLGVFVLVVALLAPAFRSSRKARIEQIEGYRLGASPAQRPKESPSQLSEQLIQIGDRVMEGRESTTRTMVLLDRADLPWRAGEWFVLRVVAVIVGVAAAYLLLGSRSAIVSVIVGVALGLALPWFGLRFLARRRARAFEFVLPDVLMLVATSLASGFSLLQSLDAVSRDAPEPAAKEFSRALAETRIGADVSDALDHMATRMDSENMLWATMAIRIQREVGGNLADTLRTTAATLREREGLRRHVRALSAEGRLSAYVLIALPIGILLWTMYSNYEYVSLLWTTFLGLLMCGAGIIAMVVGVFWMRKVVQIEV